MVSSLDFGSGGPDSSLGWGHCVAFLGRVRHPPHGPLRPV